MGAGWFRAIFFEQEHLSKTGVEKPPRSRSSRPAFSKVLPSRALCKQGYRQARYKAYSKQHTETLFLEAAGGRSKRSQATRSTPRDHLFSAQCTVRRALPAESRNDMWAQATSIPLLAQFCKSSARRQWHQLFVS